MQKEEVSDLFLIEEWMSKDPEDIRGMLQKSKAIQHNNMEDEVTRPHQVTEKMQPM